MKLYNSRTPPPPPWKLEIGAAIEVGVVYLQTGNESLLVHELGGRYNQSDYIYHSYYQFISVHISSYCGKKETVAIVSGHTGYEFQIKSDQ